MAENRLLGKEVTIRFVRSGVLQQTITAIKNFTFTYVIEQKKEDYLGETGTRQDEVYKEIAGSFLVHPESPEVMDLQKAIADRATRRLANDETVDCTFRAVFPSGKTRRVTIPDMKFGDLAFQVNGRGEYVETPFTFAAETAVVSQ